MVITDLQRLFCHIVQECSVYNTGYTSEDNTYVYSRQLDKVTDKCSWCGFQCKCKLNRVSISLPLSLLLMSVAVSAYVADACACPCVLGRSRSRRTAAVQAACRRSGAHARRTATGNDVTSSPTRRTARRTKSSSPEAPSRRTRSGLDWRRWRAPRGLRAVAGTLRQSEEWSSRRAVETCRAVSPSPPPSRDQQLPTGCDRSCDHFQSLPSALYLLILTL